MRNADDISGAVIQCYSQRLLNPFRGAVNVIRYKSAEAVTSDGVHWDIYVSNDALLDGLDHNRSVQISDIRYGRWSLETGLVRGPIYPSDEFFLLEDMGAVVYEHLLTVHDRLPFPFRDSIELWLLDKADRPLALLNAVVSEKEIDDYQLLDWRAGRLCRETFTSSCEESGAADRLIAYINGLGQSPPAAQWFKRQRGRPATGLQGHNIDESLVGREIETDDFPQFFVPDSHREDRYACLVQEFIEWQSPWMLLLHTLGREQRRFFEQRARKQALIVDRQYLLYPEIIDDSFVRSARVEAMMRRTQIRDAEQDEVMSTFYIELHPSPTE